MNTNDIHWIAWDHFETAHKGLTVNLIATPRERLSTCAPTELLADVYRRYAARYDFVPVAHGDDIVGLLHVGGGLRESNSIGEPVEQHMERLSDSNLIGADASILDYIRDVRTKPFRLVVSGTGISGMVTWSDLQDLPVRAALFSLVTGLETAMSKWVEREFTADGEWLKLLSEDRRQRVRDLIDDGRRKNSDVRPVLYTQFCDKATVLRKRGFSPALSRTQLHNDLKRIEAVRNDVAHANNYASSFDAACTVCETAEIILRMWRLIDEQIERERGG